MNPTAKKIIAIAISVAILSVAYYGEYLPLRKAQMFIATLQGLQGNPPTSLADLENRLSVPLDYPSPIGQEELVRNTANSVLGFVQQSPDATTTDELVGFLMGYYQPILSRGRGMSFGQDLYLVGAINEVAFARTGQANFLSTAQQYYEEGEQLGPNRPQPLYGLFDVYRAEGNVTGTVAIADKILTNWPSDQSVKQALAQFLAGAQTASGSAKAPAGK
ncbi:MAG TPA: hypothetical protein VMT81_01550 [Candidatus Paceibacterota bacterium]|nr:hypothetical protein [Candidatus Paceibacterota bacterium]